MRYGIDSNGKDKFFDQGVELVNQDKQVEAILKFEKSLKKNPQHIPTYTNIGFLWITFGQYNQIVKTMNMAIKKGIESSEVWHYKGYALKLLNKTREAIESLNNSIKIDPEDGDTLLLLANCHNILKNYDDALKCYDDALIINPYYDLVRSNKLTILKELKKYDVIEKFLKETAELYFEKGLEHQKNNKCLASVITYRKALNYFNYAPALENIEKVFEEINKNPKTISKFGIELYEFNNWKDKGLIFLDMGNIDNLTRENLQLKLKEFVIQNEILLDYLIIIFFKVMGIDKTLLGIEVTPGVFKKFNSIYTLPYSIFETNINKLEKIYTPSQGGSMKELIEEYGIEKINLSIWTDTTLLFYDLGPQSLTITEMYERIYILTKHLKEDLSLIKIFPFKDKLVAAIEEFSGVYDAFQQKTGLEPIILIPASKK